MDDLPFSRACENNKGVILAKLAPAFAAVEAVLEIGAGTGQHATWFSAQMPWLSWQPTELAAAMAILLPRCQALGGANLLPPRELDVCDHPWPVAVPDAVFTANTLHIMPVAAVAQLFHGLAAHAAPGTLLAIYGPFNYGGKYTSASNAEFDQWLAARSPHSAIRDFEAVDEMAGQAGFVLTADEAMPANNRLLFWRRAAPDA